MTTTRAQKRTRADLIEEERQFIENIDNIEIIDQENQRPSKKKSTVPKILDGKYFAIVNRQDLNVTAKCAVCGQERKGNVHSTGNFMDHIKKSHPELVDEVKHHRKFGSEDQENKYVKSLHKTLSSFTQEEVNFIKISYHFRNNVFRTLSHSNLFFYIFFKAESCMRKIR